MTESLSEFRRVVVVVPVHDEEDLLDACLASLSAASDEVDARVRTVIVLDACSDGSADIAASWASRGEFTIATIDRSNVGAARAAGFRSVGFRDADPLHETWFATTDADSTVHPDWLSSQLAHARAGARAIAGTVIPDFDPLGGDRISSAYHRGYRHRPGHRHVHGANLGLSSGTYYAVGGFGALACDEDTDLVQRLEHAGVPVLYSCDSPVTTSARRRGRAPDGFARHLRDMDLAVAQ